MPTRHLFQSDSFDRATRDLRRHLDIPSRRLDPRKSIRKTIRKGGVFDPAYAPRKLFPEHLVFIEERSDADHLAALYELGVSRAKNANVLSRVFRFREDPRHFVEVSRGLLSAVPGGIAGLSGVRDGQRVLLFSRASALSDQLSARPAQWTQVYDDWGSRTLLDITAPRDPVWSTRDLELAEAGWKIGEGREDTFEKYAEAETSGRHRSRILSGRQPTKARLAVGSKPNLES